MANLPEKNITTVDKITSIPSNANLYINANGEFRQATVDDVLKASPVIADSIANQYKNASGSPILLTDSAKGVAIDFDVKGRSTQDGEPNPTYPQAIKSVGNMGYFDGELLQGLYNSGVFVSNSKYVCSKNPIPCNDGDILKLAYGTITDTICFHFYDKDMNYMSYQYSKASSECEVTVPTGAKYTNFYLLEPNTSITPQTAKHICVTINDKYALIVDSKGKNELNNTATTQTVNGVTFTVNEDKSVTVNDTASANATLYLTTNFPVISGESYIISGAPVGSTSTKYMLVYQKRLNGVFVSSGYVYEKEVTLVADDTYNELYLGIFVASGQTVSNLTFYPMIRPLGTDATYEPYIHSRKYIPISAPLRGLGEVTDVARLTEGKVDRKSLKSVYVGTESGWSYFKAYNDYYIVSIPIPSNAKIANALCSHFIYTQAGVPSVGQFTIAVNRFVTFGFSSDIASTLDEFKAWLSANPITVIYELAKPTTETIEPIDVVTYDNVTHISVSDNAEMEVEYPASKVAGIASIGWSKGRRAEYDLEQLKVQMLALQTTIVSTV